MRRRLVRRIVRHVRLGQDLRLQRRLPDVVRSAVQRQELRLERLRRIVRHLPERPDLQLERRVRLELHAELQRQDLRLERLRRHVRNVRGRQHLQHVRYLRLELHPELQRQELRPRRLRWPVRNVQRVDAHLQLERHLRRHDRHLQRAVVGEPEPELGLHRRHASVRRSLGRQAQLQVQAGPRLGMVHHHRHGQRVRALLRLGLDERLGRHGRLPVTA